MATVFRRGKGKMYYSKFQRNGKRIVVALSPYKEKAEQMCRDLLDVYSAEKNGIAVKDSSWFAFREKYLSHRKIKTNFKTHENDVRAFNMVEKYGRTLTRLNQMTPEYLEDFWIKAKSQELSDRTISGYIRILKTAMHKAEDWNMVPMQLWRKVKCLPDGQREEYLSLAEFDAVLKASEGPYHRATMLLGYGGFRRGEILHLEWSDVDFKNRLIHVRSKMKRIDGTDVAVWAPKGSRPGKPKNRVVPMLPELEDYLKGLPDKNGLVLAQRIDENNFGRYYRNLGRKMGLHLFPHKFRHTCASFIISAPGNTDRHVGEVLGQNDPRSTKVYTHMMPHAKRAAMDRMGETLRMMRAEQRGQ